MLGDEGVKEMAEMLKANTTLGEFGLGGEETIEM